MRILQALWERIATLSNNGWDAAENVAVFPVRGVSVKKFALQATTYWRQVWTLAGEAENSVQKVTEKFVLIIKISNFI